MPASSVASLLEYQLKRAASSGDTEDALAQLQKFLELERQAKLVHFETAHDELDEVVVFPTRLRAPFIS